MAKSLSQITFEFEAAEPVLPVDAGQGSSGVDLHATERGDTSAGADEGNGVNASATAGDELLLQDQSAPLKQAAKSTRGRRSLREQAMSADLMQIPDDEQLFSKQYYSMGEVATMFRENQSLIRYWETEFDVLKPKKNRKGDRFFRPEDVKNLVLIYDLLRRRKFTIEGARDYLKNNKKADEKFELIRSLEKIRSFLYELRASV